MFSFSRWVKFGVFTLALTGCAGAGESGQPTRSAYDKVCHSVYMTKAAAREARWCWNAVGAESYEEWALLERLEGAERPITASAQTTRAAH